MLVLAVNGVVELCLSRLVFEFPTVWILDLVGPIVKLFTVFSVFLSVVAELS